jgi:hypothetical protein
MAEHEPKLPKRLSADSHSPDSIAVQLGGGDRIPEGYVSFKGYLGPADDKDVHRLFMTDTFWSWLELAADDIKGRLDVPADQHDARSVVWVKRNAQVIKCQAGTAQDMEDEVWGINPAGAAIPPRRPPW